MMITAGEKDTLGFDKRAVSLFPYLYKLDDFEEKLKEHLKNNSDS